MKKSFIRRILSVVLSCTVMTLSCAAVSSEEYNVPGTSELLEIYNRKFELLNEKYGTDFEIAVSDLTEAKLDKLMTDYYNMTDEEFEEYFLDLKEKSDAFLKRQSEIHGTYNRKSGCSFDDLLRKGAEIKVYSAKNGAKINTPAPCSSPSAEEYQLIMKKGKLNEIS